MLTIYTHKKSQRLLYTLDFVLKENFGLQYKVTTDASTFRSHMGPRLNYSMENFKDESLHIFPVLLLFQEDVTEHQFQVKAWDGVKVFYNVNKGDLPFDVFAATFFMISRYEEYLYAKRDRFGRYDPRNSVAWKNGFLYEPVVNIWLNRLREILSAKFPDLNIKKAEYSFRPSIDVDNAWAYMHKGLLRTTGGLLMNMIKNRFHNYGHRLRVLLGFENDPFDTYEAIDRVHAKYNLKPYIFFLLGNYGGYDRAVSYNNKYYRELIHRYSETAHVGIHASYASSLESKHLAEEIAALDDITGKEVKCNRFHYIKFEMPKSYEQLIKNEITKDFSMGYPSRPGFRAGYAGSFKFFNLKTNQSTNLRIYPFQIMDATLNFYSKHNPHEAYDKAVEIIDKVKAVGGELITVWHNESFSDISPWKGWDTVYERIVDYAVPSK